MPPRPVDLKRDSAFSMEVGTDGDPIREALPIGEDLYILSEHSIHLVRTADSLDPERSKPHVPHVQQKAYSVGVSSEYVCRTLLQAKYLFNGGLIDRRFDRTALFKCVIAFFDDLIALKAMFDQLLADQQAAVDATELPARSAPSLALPSIGDAFGRAKNFVNRAEHCAQSMFALCNVFLGVEQKWFDGITKAAELQGRLSPGNLEALKGVALFAKFLKNVRNCVEHPRADQRLAVLDFAMNLRSEVDYPTIEVIHPQTPEAKLPLIRFEAAAISSLTQAFETAMVAMADAHTDPHWDGKCAVFEFPPDRRLSPQVRFYFALNLGGVLTPIG